MNDLFRLKLADHARGKDFASRVSFVEEDFFCDLCAPEQLQAKMPDDVAGEGFDAVIAGLFLHHYGADVKAEFFGRARAALKPGGVLVLCEAMAFDSPSLSQFAHDFGDNWIRKQFSDPDQHLRPKRDSLGADAGRLRDEWLYHWNHTHIYATDVHLRSAREPRNREPSYTEMAHDAGFRDLGLPFRFWEVGVLWARS